MFPPNPFYPPALAPGDETIAVVIPMYRVEAYIQDVIRALPDWVRIIVAVDDASPDAGAQRVRELNDPRVALVTHSVNQGVGGAMVSGFRKALELGATLVVKMDGDGQMPAEFLEALLEPILSGRADFAKGNRFASSAHVTAMPGVRRWGNLGLSFITKAASGYWNIFDPTNGFIAMDAEMLRSVRLDQLHPRYFFESSLLMELNRSRAVIVDVPMPARYRSEISSLSVTRSLIEFPPLLLRAGLRRIIRQYFIADFSVGSLYLLAGLLLTLFGVIWGLAWWVQSVRSGVVATTGTVMIAALPIMIGVQLLLQFTAYDIQSVPRSPFNRRGRIPWLFSRPDHR